MDNTFKLDINADGIATLTFDLKNEKVNKLSLPVLSELDEVLNKISINSAVKALVIKSGKPDIFIAGADLKGFEDSWQDPPQAGKLIKKGHEVFDRISHLPFPTIAVIDGVCLGGGMELALACTYRVASDNPKTQLGLPEVTLGIMPGWGGTQRMPRLVGLEQGINMIITGKPVDARKASKVKLVDAIYPKEFLNAKVDEFVAYSLAKGNKEKILDKRKVSGFRALLLEKNCLGRALLFYQMKKGILAATKGHYPAPLVALKTIKDTYSIKLEKGLQIEKNTFISAIPKEFRNAINLIKLFFAQEEVKKNPGTPPNAKASQVKSGGVIGAGIMGAGIAWLFSSIDIPVRLKDISWASVGRGTGAIYEIYKKLIKIRKMKDFEVSRKFQLVSGTVDFSGFQQTDLIVEAAVENLELKLQIFKDLEQVIRSSAIVASNTSSLTIDSMAVAFKHPERFLGMHFFNPPNRMPLVEIIAGTKTSPDAIATAVELCKRMKKVPLVVKDCPGFLVNRIFAMAANEACWMLQEGVPMERLEKVMTDFGMPMGPFTLADEVGNDVAYKVFGAFESAYGSRMKCPQIIKEVYDHKFLGKKNGIGYFVYDGKKRSENAEIKTILRKINSPKKEVSDSDIVDRIVFGMVNEASRCLQEQIVGSPSHVDIALIYGVGFPPFLGGLLRYADQRGVETVVKQLERFVELYGDRFKPSDRLLEMARSNQKFYALGSSAP